MLTYFELAKHHSIKSYWGSGGIAPRIIWPRQIDGGEWSVSRPGRFTPWKSPWYPLNRRLDGLQSRSERGGEEKNSQSPPENRTLEPQSSSP
jgi:hypothetical protein